MAIEAVGRTTPAIATSSGGEGERVERWGVGGDVVSCDRSLSLWCTYKKVLPLPG